MKPEPGVYPDVPMLEYSTWDCANYSTLKHFKRSAAHARASMVKPREQTPAMLLGQATHSAVLEPELFIEEYAAAPPCDKRTKVGKKIWADFCRDNEGKEILRASEYDQCMKMSKSAGRDAMIANILSEVGINEMSFVWEDSETGVLCKGRCDRFGYIMGNSAIVDLKTTEDASGRGWIREVLRYQYHAQAAFYLDGLNTLEPKTDRQFVWITLEKDEPYAVSIYQPDEATLGKGRAMYRNYLRQWFRCNETGMWPGYPSGIQSLLIPEWALRWEEGEDEI
jgi:exodeoxyribonuclease VIII